jgi:hypothetical protein
VPGKQKLSSRLIGSVDGWLIDGWMIDGLISVGQTVLLL